jgi:hypothetical protein
LLLIRFTSGLLKDTPVTAIRYHSILFSLHPFANIWSALFTLHAISFTTHQKSYRLTIDHANVFQIQGDVSVVRLEFEQSPQLGDRRFRDSATQDEHGDSPSCLSLNPESHRSGHLSLECARINGQYEQLIVHLAFI